MCESARLTYLMNSLFRSYEYLEVLYMFCKAPTIL